MPRTRLRTAALALASLLALSGLAACGNGDNGVAETGTTEFSETTTSAPAETTTTSTTAPPAAVTDVALTATEYSYATTSPTSVPAGQLHVTLTNNGAEEHQATIVKFKPGKTLGDLAAAGAADPTGRAVFALVDGYGGPNSAAPSGSVVSADAVVTPGDYLFICFIPAPDGVPHASKGMVLPFTVTAGESGTSALQGDGEIALQDYEFTVPDGFTGQGTFTIANEGPQSHELAVYRVADGKTFADVQAFYASQTPAGPPPTEPAGGVAALAPGTPASVELELTTGTYVFMCFLPDATTGAPHFTLGMLQEVDIP